MGWGWSNISISIKSDMLAKLLREYGITPKGAGNVKKGIRYDVDFEWQYESRYEYMAQEISSAGDLVLYYISCVLAVETGKEQRELKKAYVRNMDAIDKSVECAYYSAVVWTDVDPTEESYSFKLNPPMKRARKGTVIFDDPKTAAPSWNRWFNWLGEREEDRENIKLLKARGWMCNLLFDDDRSYYDTYGIAGRYCVVCDRIAQMADAGEITRELQLAMEYRKKYRFLLVRESDFLALGNYQIPVCNHTIETLNEKNVAVLGEFLQLTYNQMKKTVTERGGITSSKLKNYSDYVIIPDNFRMINDELHVIQKAEEYFAKNGKPVILSETQYLQQLSNIGKVIPQTKKPEVDPSLPVTYFTGKIFVVNGFSPAAAKKIKERITAVGGIVRARVSKSTNYVVYNSEETKELAGVTAAKQVNAEGGHVVIINEVEAAELF